MMNAVAGALTPTQTDEYLRQFQCNGYHLAIDELANYQRYANLLRATSRRPSAATTIGAHRSRQRGAGMEFDESRHYQPGDDIRAIDWRVTARTGKTHTKIFCEEKERPVVLAVDFLPSMLFGSQFVFKHVQAAHAASLLAWHTVQSGDRVSSLVFNSADQRISKLQARAAGALRIIENLISHQPSAQRLATKVSQQRYEAALSHLASVVRPGSRVYLFSDYAALSKATLPHFAAITRRCNLTAIQVVDPMELQLPDASSQLCLSDGFNQTLLDLNSNQQRHRYETEQNRRMRRIHTALKQLNVPVRMVSTALPITHQINDGQLGVQI